MVKKYLRKMFSKKAGAAPGTLVSAYTGNLKVDTMMDILRYNETDFEVKDAESVEDNYEYLKDGYTNWINVYGIHDGEALQKIGKEFNIGNLHLEDFMNIEQRPKFESDDDHVVFVLKMISYDDHEEDIKIEQVSLAQGKNYVVVFQERQGDVFDGVRDRIKNTKWRIRKLGSDYLLYALIDAVVDNYFIVLEKLSDKLEKMEDDLLENPTEDILHTIHHMKREMIFLRKSIWPLREAISRFMRDDNSVMSDALAPYFRDIYEHVIQAAETVETFKDVISGMYDMYMSGVSNRMNEVMKVLTIIATIFIPITFLAGIYGMNFEFMPELKYRWAYPVFWGLVVAAVVVMVAFFKRKKWL